MHLVVVALMTLVVAGCGARSPDAQPGVPRIANGEIAVVRSQVITKADVDALLDEAAVSFRALARPFPKEGTPYYLDLRDQAVRYLVQRSARLQEAERLGARVDPADVEREIARIDRETLREEHKRSGLTVARVRQDVSDSLLEIALFEAVISRKESDESNVEAMKGWKRRLDSLVAEAKYAPGLRPARRPRSPIPPELASLSKAKGPCDLKDGTYTIREVAAHGCSGEFGIGIPGIEGPGCGDVPIDDFATGATLASPDTPYGNYEEELMDTASECVPYPSTTYTVWTGKGPCFAFGPDDPCTDGRMVPQRVISANW